MNHVDILKKETGRNLIYKYVKFDHSRPGFLQTELFRFTQPNDLNDPFEARPRVLMNNYAPEDYEVARAKAAADGGSKLSLEELEGIYMSPATSYRFDEKHFPGLWPAHLPELRNEPFHSIEELDRFRADKALSEFIDKASRTIGILCLTREPHSLLMWAHYANGHRGMLLAFDQDHAFFTRGNGLHAVEYREERVSITFNDGLMHFCGIHFEDSMSLFPRAFLRKHPIWSYEAELRMILPLDDCDKCENDKEQKIWLSRIPAEALCAIVLGARISKAVDKFVRLLLARDHRWTHIKLFQAVLDEKNMALNYLDDPIKGENS